MMRTTEIDRATREELAEELGAGGEFTGDWRTASLDDLRERVRELVSRYTDYGTVRRPEQSKDTQ